MDLGPQVTSLVTQETNWDASTKGDSTARPIKLDISLFTANTHYPNGTIPSGIVLAKVTASGLWGPYSDAASDGRTTAVGFLNKPVKVTSGTATPGASLKWEGVINVGNLPTGNGLDANGRADLAAKFYFIG